jgi:hypothetical protein
VNANNVAQFGVHACAYAYTTCEALRMEAFTISQKALHQRSAPLPPSYYKAADTGYTQASVFVDGSKLLEQYITFRKFRSVRLQPRAVAEPIT